MYRTLITCPVCKHEQAVELHKITNNTSVHEIWMKKQSVLERYTCDKCGRRITVFPVVTYKAYQDLTYKIYQILHSLASGNNIEYESEDHLSSWLEEMQEADSSTLPNIPYGSREIQREIIRRKNIREEIGGE